MILTPMPVEGPMLIDIEPRSDDRGFFARTFDSEAFRSAGLQPLVEQCNLSWNSRGGTLRGMHFQVSPHPEAKLVRCVRGAIVDIIVDMRPDSPTRLQHVSATLSAENRRALYVPPYFAHGYLTLEDDTEVVYQVSGTYAPAAERGLRYDDPDLGITWPAAVACISTKDASWPLLSGRDPADLAGSARTEALT